MQTQSECDREVVVTVRATFEALMTMVESCEVMGKWRGRGMEGRRLEVCDCETRTCRLGDLRRDLEAC